MYPCFHETIWFSWKSSSFHGTHTKTLVILMKTDHLVFMKIIVHHHTLSGTDWLTEWLAHWLIVIGSLTLTDWPTNWLTSTSSEWTVNVRVFLCACVDVWMIDWPTSLLTIWSAWLYCVTDCVPIVAGCWLCWLELMYMSVCTLGITWRGLTHGLTVQVTFWSEWEKQVPARPCLKCQKHNESWL